LVDPVEEGGGGGKLKKGKKKKEMDEDDVYYNKWLAVERELYAVQKVTATTHTVCILLLLLI
jgi:hypothetical protein